MKSWNIKTILLLITYTIGLVLCVINFRDIMQAITNFIGLFSTFFLAVAIAFIFNRPYEFFRHKYRKKFHLKGSTSKVLSIISIYVIVFGCIGLLISLILPQVGENIRLLSENITVYLAQLQDF